MKHLLYLAPMRGFTDHVYRQVHGAHFGTIDMAVAPFLSSVAGKIKSAHIQGLSPRNNTTMPVIPQILGNSPEDFITMAEVLFDLGYRCINWNLGCPFPQVAKKFKGSGLLPHPDRVDAFLERVHSASSVRVSIKTRLGRFRFDEIYRMIRVFNRYPLDEIIVHPRTGIQMYEGEPDLDSLETLLDMTRHRVVYNGDILSPRGLRRLRDRFPSIRRWMIGRGVLANPFLPGQLKCPDVAPPNPVAEFKAFHDDLFHAYRDVLSGPAHLLDRMKGFWKYFHIPFVDGRHVRKKIHRARSVDAYLSAVNRYFESEAVWTGIVTTGPMQRAAG
ncbi:MAG: tRNA-dihydrouridine synthase family protein [Desulfobacterales bacterium]